MAQDKKEMLTAGEYASPPCFMHELSADYQPRFERSNAWADVARWRKAERSRLIAMRLAMSVDERNRRSHHIAASLDRTIASIIDRAVSRSYDCIISIYWPFRGEPDLRDWATGMIGRGARIALPVVIRKDWPLEFRVWAPGDPLERGVWNILAPSRGPAVEPDIVIAPVVGFDAANYRLGYGGGFFDRTLAKMIKKPLAIGVGYEVARIATIYPQPHDIGLSTIITDA